MLCERIADMSHTGERPSSQTIEIDDYMTDALASFIVNDGNLTRLQQFTNKI